MTKQAEGGRGADKTECPARAGHVHSSRQLIEMLASIEAEDRRAACAQLAVRPSPDIGRELLAALEREEDETTLVEMARSLTNYGNPTIMDAAFYKDAGRVILSKLVATESMDGKRELIVALSYSAHVCCLGDAIMIISKLDEGSHPFLADRRTGDAISRISEAYFAYCAYG